MLSLRSLIITGLILLVTVLLSACMTGAYVATELENADRKKAYTQHIAIFKQHIKALQDKGDPLGDYFYALGNSDGWIKDVKDTKEITALFEKAAAKGSMDAKILLALQEATSEPLPGHLNEGVGPRENLKAWESGLAKLLPLLQQQCYARRLVVGDGILSEALPQVDYYSISGKIWPMFRDGRHSLIKDKNGEWSLLIAKDPERYKLWEDIDSNCNHKNELFDTPYNK
ncbi:MAG: hypothetical protein HOP26_06225 [Methylotenera sp.]|nr:hypothetical protein [Methylotenera sp.]NOU40102.1 hypothetical protein [Methylotenera sp.]